MQSAHPDDLRLLERQHDFFDVVQAVRWSRKAGFNNLNLDLIFGLPAQSLARWQETLERAVEMGPEHLSLYSLTIEHGTPLQRRWARGMIPLVDDDLAADMYEYAMDSLPQSGFEQYEISNWARHGADSGLLACRHNLQYWRNQPYLGLGAGAHGYAVGTRTINVGGIRPFIERCAAGKPVQFPSGPATRRTIRIDRFEEMQETMMVGLRLTQEGVSEAAFNQRFGESLRGVFGTEIERLVRMGLLEWVGEHLPRLRLTRRGRLLGNQVFMQFVGPVETRA
jgi:oxygen-independent coproporphyrinogen-3 oxidase